MIPLFKSHYSIGKSILKLSASQDKESADGVFDIASELKLDTVCLVEDSLTGFLEAAKTSKEKGIHLIFGLRITACDTHSTEKEDCHKIVVFAKNDEGCKTLNKIYSETFSHGNNSIEMSKLAKLWEEKNLKLAIPFYDSFIHKNAMSFANCAPVFNFTKPTFFIEDNDLPFDQIIKKNLLKFCEEKKLQTEQVKSIFYKNRKDFDAFVTYKCICNRGSWAGKTVSLEKPNLDHCGSKEFCIESWKEKQ